MKWAEAGRRNALSFSGCWPTPDRTLRHHRLLESDRLSRGMYPAAALMEVVEAHQVRLEAVMDAIDMKTFGLMAAIGKIELDNFQERSTLGKRGTAKQGRVPTGGLSYGYRIRDDGRPEVVEEQAEVVRRIFHMYIHEGMGSPSIAVRLTDEGPHPDRQAAVASVLHPLRSGQCHLHGHMGIRKDTCYLHRRRDEGIRPAEGYATTSPSPPATTSANGMRVNRNRQETWLESLAKLEVLNLGGNELIGEIPTGLGDLANLKVLGLGGGGNELSGEIPSELRNLANLRVFDLSENQLTGPVPTWLGSLAYLEVLHLGANELSGGIPAGLGSLSYLEALILGGNELSGEIPAELGDLANLKILRPRRQPVDGVRSGGIAGGTGRWLRRARPAALRSVGNSLRRKLCGEAGRSGLRDGHVQQRGLRLHRR